MHSLLNNNNNNNNYYYYYYKVDLSQTGCIRNKHLILYADDILLYRAIKCETDYSVPQDDINTINYWVEENHMQFNTAKCKYMLSQ